MEQYNPGLLGKIIPADNSSKMNDFMINKFDSFNKIYDICKTQSSSINDVKMIDNNSSDISSLSVKIETDMNTLGILKDSLSNPDITMDSGILTART